MGSQWLETASSHYNSWLLLSDRRTTGYGTCRLKAQRRVTPAKCRSSSTTSSRRRSQRSSPTWSTRPSAGSQWVHRVGRVDHSEYTGWGGWITVSTQGGEGGSQWVHSVRWVEGAEILTYLEYKAFHRITVSTQCGEGGSQWVHRVGRVDHSEYTGWGGWITVSTQGGEGGSQRVHRVDRVQRSSPTWSTRPSAGSQ